MIHSQRLFTVLKRLIFWILDILLIFFVFFYIFFEKKIKSNRTQLLIKIVIRKKLKSRMETKILDKLRVKVQRGMEPPKEKKN